MALNEKSALASYSQPESDCFSLPERVKIIFSEVTDLYLILFVMHLLVNTFNLRK